MYFLSDSGMDETKPVVSSNGVSFKQNVTAKPVSSSSSDESESSDEEYYNPYDDYNLL